MTQTQAAKKTGRDLTKGSIIGNLLSLSWPMIATESIYTLSVLEMVWVGRLGAAALAGVGIAFIVVMLILTAQIGLSVAARAMIARAIGAGNEAEANHVARQGIFLAVSYGLVMTVVGVTLAGPILRVFNLEPGCHSRKHNLPASVFDGLDTGFVLSHDIRHDPGIGRFG